MKQIKSLLFMILYVAFTFTALPVKGQSVKLPDKIMFSDTAIPSAVLEVENRTGNVITDINKFTKNGEGFVSPKLKVQVKPPATTISEAPPGPGNIIDKVKGVKSWEDILNLETGLYTLLITLGGYFSYLIPGLKSISNNTYRVLVWAVFVIIGVSMLGFGSVWQGALSYLFSTSLYEVILKWLVKSPVPNPV